MQFAVRKTDLLAELQLVQGVVEKKTTVPILSNLLMRATKEGLEITATDMELGIESRCEAEVKAAGAITVHARKLHDIVKSFPDEEVRFSLQGEARLRIQCAKADFKVACQGVEEFPTLREYDFKGAVAVPMEALREMIRKVEFAITTDDPRYALMGAQLVVRKGKIELVATDGHRLAWVTRDLDVAVKEEMRPIIPKKALVEIGKLEPGPEGEVKLGVRDSHIFVQAGARTLQSVLFDASFPNYERVMPQANDKIVHCAVAPLLAALNRVCLLSSERTKSVKVTFEGETLTVATSNPEFGEAEEAVEVTDYQGAPLTIGFNGRYLTEFLSALGGGEVRMELKDDQTQVLLRPREGDGSEYRYVVMPMRA